MRRGKLQSAFLAGLGGLWLAWGGCGPEKGDASGESLIPMVAAAAESETDLRAATSTSPQVVPAADAVLTAAGFVTGRGDYRLFDLGPAGLGQAWLVASGSGTGTSFLLALFDANYELLRRETVSVARPLEHTVRADTPALYLGVTPLAGSGGGEFHFEISRQHGQSVPAPAGQVAWVNFGGATDVSVHARGAISFPAFDAATLGSAYVGSTTLIKAAILNTVREDYAPYNVTILSSDDGPEPEGPHAAIHIGGRDERLLGLADNVDQYNEDPWQTAIIYVEGFADFAVMGLDAEEMGQMIGNVVSHELGHLLGLFHTRVPTDVMDTTGTAWDLAGQQMFGRAELEASVFPFGYENSPQRLAETVGYNPSAGLDNLAKSASTERIRRKASLRALAYEVLRSRCGTCLHLDD